MTNTISNTSIPHKNLIPISRGYSNNPFFNGCDYVMRASGESMQSIIKRNDILGLYEVDQWEAFIPYGEVYAILTKSGHLMLKKIINGKDDDHYTLVSEPLDDDKSIYPPQQISKSLIDKIFVVKSTNTMY